MVVQKYLHDLTAWDALRTEEQERVIGRTKLSDIEMADDVKPPDSHIALNVIEDENGYEQDIMRFNLPFGTVGTREFGTYFIGYAKDPAVIEQMLENMFYGTEDAAHDRILDFSTAITGTLFVVPTVDWLEDPPAPGDGDGTAVGRGRRRPDARPRRRLAGDGSLGVGSLRPLSSEPLRQRRHRRALQQRRHQHREEHEIEELDAARDVVDHRERREHDRHAAAQARPPDQRALLQSQPRSDRRHERRQRPRDQRDHEREHRPAPQHVPQLTGEHEQAEREEHAELRDAGKALVERVQRAALAQTRGADHQRGDVHREEARAADRARRRRRRAWRSRTTQTSASPSGATTSAAGSAPSSHPIAAPTTTADRQLVHEEPDRVQTGIAAAA